MELKKFSAQSHQGPFLDINEDGYDFDFENDLYMVFDGFGGNGIGDLAVDNLKTNIKSFFNNFVKDRNSTLPFFFSQKYLIEGNALINAALLSHEKLYKSNISGDHSKQAGATGIIAVKSESILSILSVGNCRCYLSKKGVIYSIFADDSFRFLNSDLYESHNCQIPLSAFGLFSDLSYQLREIRVSEGDKVLFVTDGVYSRLNDQEILSSISTQTIDINSKIKDLFELANQRGNLDNQTCMILEF